MGGAKLLGRLLASSTLSGRGVAFAPDGVGGGGAVRRGHGSQLTVLEPRVLFDAAFAETLDSAPSHGVDQAEAADAESRHDNLIAALSEMPVLIMEEVQLHVELQSLAFVDDKVENFDDIIAAFGPEVEVHIITSDRDGVEQMAAVLASRSNISSVHIISHGEAGALSLGATTLDANSIAGEHADELAVIAAALSADADILIYGCDFAAGEQGETAVQLLASATEADVAASNDITGAVDLGGDWTLEVEQGEITTASIAAWNWFSTLASQVINSGGGNAADGSDGLQIHVIDNGQLQIGYQLTGSAAGNFQLYHQGVASENPALFNGIYLAIGNQVTGSDNGADGAAQEALWGEGGQTLTGTGTAADPYVVTTTLFSNTDGNASYNPATDVQVVIRTIYVVPNGYFTQEVTVTPPPTNTQDIKYYHTLDTYLAGADEGPAFSLPQNLAQTNNTVGDPSVVGVRKDPGGPNESFVAFAEVQGGRQFDHWYSAFYTGDNLYGHTIAAGIDGGGDIVNTWDTNPATDNGLGVQFTLGAINTPTTWSYLVTFTSEASIDLDADDSSGATGSSYNTTYTAGSGATIPVADVDAHISNVTGDIQEVRVTLNNMQAGDSLTVNFGALPPGVQVVSQTTSEIILGAVGIPQTEATFDAAIQAVGFTSSSSSISVRNIDFAITNELGIEGFASATTIGINQPPIANNDSFTVNEDAILMGNLFANNGSGADSDPEGDTYTITAVNGASFTVGVPIVLANGELTITNAATGAFTFEPNLGYSGPASFTYSITDVEGGVDTATASITVDSINDAPQGSDAVLSATEDTPRAFTAGDFGFSDPNDSPANALQSVIITTLPATGTLLLSGNPVNAGDTIPVAQIPNLTWTPPLNTSGAGQGAFTFQVVDNGGTANGGQNTDQSPNALSFTVLAVNDLPVLDLDGNNSSGAPVADYVTTYIENSPGINIVDVTDVVLTDVDSTVSEIVITLTDGQIGDTLNFPSSMPGGITAAVSPVATLTAAGTMTVTLTGTGATTLANWQAVLASVTFLPSTNDVNNPNPADRHITVQAWDDGGAPSNLATSTIHVTPQNDPPTLDLDDNNSSGVNAGNVGVSYTENGAAVALHSGIVTSDLDDTDYASAQVVHTNPQAGDVISINGGAVSAGDTGSVGPVSYSVSVNLGGQLVVDFSGTATLAQYTAALQAVSFSNSSENPSVIQRDITFQINDGSDTSSLRHAFVTVTAVNDAPVGSPIPQQSGQDSEALTPLDVSGFFTDPDSPTLTYSLAPGAPAWLSINATTGVISGTPPLHASTTTNGTTPGTWDVTVVASDGGTPNLSDSVSLTYVITNPPPTAQADQLNATEGTLLSGVNVFSNNGSGADSDVDGDTFTVTQVGGAALNVGVGTASSAGGLFTIGSNGALLFADNGDFEDLGVGESRDTTITYQITDADGGTSTATVTVTVTGSNDPPVVSTPFTDPASVTDGNTGFTFNGASAFTDPDGDTLSYSLGAGAPSWLMINPATGVVSVVGSIPADASQNTNIVAGSDGTYNVQVIATDPTGGTANDTFMMTVTNLAPVAQDDAASVGEDAANATGNVITGPGMDSDTAPDSDPLTVVSASQGANAITIGTPFTTAGGGVLTLLAGGGYTFTPGTAYNGLDVGETAVETISYVVDDGNGGQDTAVLVITINGANDAPVPVDPGNPGPDPENPIPADPNTIVPLQTADDGETFTAGSPLVNLAPFIVDPDAEPVTFSTTSTLPAGLTLNADGTVTGTIAANASQGGDIGTPGIYTISVDVSDGSVTVQLLLTIDVSNLGPVAVNDSAVTTEDAASVGGNAITNDDDTAPDGDVLHVSSVNGDPSLVGETVAGSAGGRFTLANDGTWTFEPGLDFQNLNDGDSRTTTLTYQVSDGQGGTATATVSVTVSGSNDAPVTLGPIGPQAGVDGQPITPIAAGASFDNPTGLPLTFSATGLPPGLAIDPGTGEVSGTLQNDASIAGPYIIHVTASASGGVSATIPVLLAVSNPAPVAMDDGVATAVNTPVTLSPLANDSDPDGDDLSVSIATAPANGTIVVNGDGTLSYTPDSGFTGVDSFTYQVSDGQGGVDVATVTIAVGAANPDVPTGTSLAGASGTDGSAIAPIATAPAFSDPNGDPLSFSAIGLPPGLSIDPVTGVVTGTLTSDASLAAPYVTLVTATDPSGNQVTLPLVIVVNNPAPAAADDVVSVPLNTATTLNPLANDSDPDGDALQITFASAPAHGGVTINDDGTLTYTPVTGYTGSDSFTYTVSDGQGGTDSATVMLSVGGPLPNAPTAGPVPAQSGVDGAPVTIDVAILAAVSDPNGDPLTYSAVGLPDGLAINPSTGVVSGTLDHDASQGGPYSVQVFATDPAGHSVGVAFILAVSNPAPGAASDTVETPEGAPVTIAVLANDNDPDHDPLTVTSVVPPLHGTVVLNADGSITYTPADGFSGMDTFSYTIADGNGGTATATVVVDVGPVTALAPPPALPPITLDDGETLAPVNVLDGFGDLDDSSDLLLSVDPALMPAWLNFNPTTGEFTGVAPSDASQGATPGEPAGTYIIPVTATDSHGASVTQLVTIEVGNLAPVAVNDTASVDEDAVSVAGDALANDDDAVPDNDVLHVATVNGAAGNVGQPVAGSTGGSFILNQDGTWSFDPGQDFQNLNSGDNRSTSITYAVSDGQGGTSTATITVTVDGSNDAPLTLGPIPPQYGTDGAVITPIAAGAAFENPTSLPLVFTASGLPTGLAIDAGTGEITGTLESDASVLGPYLIYVTATGPAGETATIPLQLNASNPAPVAAADGAGTAVDAPVTIAPLGNDSDPDGDTLTVSSVSNPANGSVVINPDGTVTYTPDNGFVGTDTFTYVVSDGQGGTATETVTVTVGPPGPNAPTGTSLADATGVDGSPITPISTASAFTDPNGDPLSFAATGLPPGLSVNPATGEITGTLPNNASSAGPYVAQITAMDPDGNQVTLPLVIVVSNPAPLADDDAAATAVDTAITLNPLGNDHDPDGDALQISHVSAPLHGSVVRNPDGTLTYTPDSGFTGSDSFTYTVSDGEGGTDIATVNISVGVPVPDKPNGGPIAPQNGTDGSAISIDVAALGTVSDPNGDPLTYSAAGLPPGLSIDPGSGIISGTLPHDASAGGPYLVQIFAADPDGNTIGIPFVLTVSNPAPVAHDDLVETPKDTPVIIAVLGNDADSDGDPLTISATTAPLHGTVAINPNGSITYRPADGYLGPDSFTYTISDGNGGTSTATVALDVGPVDTIGAPPAIAPTSGTDGETITPFSVVAAFGDADDVAGITFAVDPDDLPPGINFNPLTGTFSGTAQNDASQGSTDGELPGTYVVPVTATDGNGAEVTLLVTFNFANLAPVAVDDQSTGDEDAQQSGNVLTDTVTGDGDTAPDSDPLSVTIVNGLAVPPGSSTIVSLTHGTLVLGSDGAWVFTPNATANALPVGTTVIETVSYTIDDGNGAADTATLDIEISGVNDAPFGVGDVPDQRDYEGEEVEIDVSGFFDDVDSTDVLTFAATGLPPGLSIDPVSGLITGTPLPGAASTEPYVVSVTVDDGHGGTFTMSFEWRIDTAVAPPLPPGGPPPAYPPLVTGGSPDDDEDVITNTVNGIADLNGTPDLGEHVVVTAVEGIMSLNSATDLSYGDDVITRLVAWAGRQGRSASWMHGLLDELAQQPYAGDSIDLALSIAEREVLGVHTLLQGGALFVGIDNLADGVQVLGVTGADGAPLPDYVAVIDARTLVVNVRPDLRWLTLQVVARDGSGRITSWQVMLNPASAEIMPATGLGEQISSVIDAMRGHLVTQQTSGGPTPLRSS
jgi:VCBS repeat-containing protein